MSIRNLIILSQINPPAKRSRVLQRERVHQKLQRSLVYPITILEAGTGYGKSTAILSFLEQQDLPIYWFTISGTDRDPTLFLAKLFTAFNQRGLGIGNEALRILDMPDATQKEALISFLNAISQNITEDTLFIMDDFHRVGSVPEIMGFMDWMIENLPRNLHLIIATRHHLEFPSLNKWQVKGSLLSIDKEALTFTTVEVHQLFEEHYGITLPNQTIKNLLDKTEGWAIGLQMVWQTLQSNPGMDIQQVLEDDSSSRSALFGYLAEEVLSGLAPDLQDFLIKTSILSKLDSATCDFLLTVEHSDRLLTQLHKTGLFIEELRPGVFRYHQMFREFLLTRLQRDMTQKTDLHRKAASYFRAHEYWEEAIFHLLSAHDYVQINQVLENIGEKMIADGRQESINYWIHEIPTDIRNSFPYIIYLSGEVNRYLENFEEALECYHKAERLYRKQGSQLGISTALQGQAQVFLDTIRPVNADQLLQNALKLLDPLEMPQEVADLLVLTAENQLNLGFPDSAETLLSQARDLRPDFEKETDIIQTRVFLRTGRLQQGIDLLHDREADNPTLFPARPQRFHRESTLLLSLFYSIMGDIDKAEHYARQGIEIGENLQSTFVQSVGFMRLGHALLLRSQHPFNRDGFERAMHYFQESINKIDVTRIHVEPLWGMCRALGYTGHLQEAEQLAFESLEIAKKAGDEWISVLIQLSLGAGAVLAGNHEAAQEYLTTAEVSSMKVKDPFTLCAARLWLSIKAWRQGFQNTAFGYLEKMLPLIKEHGYDFLLTRETLMGLKDPEVIYPMLIAAKENGIDQDCINSLLKSRGLNDTGYHPGYSLWVRTLGEFRTWRGNELIDSQSWHREKARQLFQLLIANRDKWLPRDQINEMLWADTPVENATNYLKVVLNTLNQVIEPERPRGESSYFIERNQDNYRLNPRARIIIDIDLFTQFIKDDTLFSLQRAVNLYQGRYFQDAYIQEWLMVEDQYFHQQFLLAAEKLVARLIEQKQYEKALENTYKILNIDSLWEPAYRSQMRIFCNLGRYSMVREVFQQCQEVMEREIGTAVSPLTAMLYKDLLPEA